MRTLAEFARRTGRRTASRSGGRIARAAVTAAVLFVAFAPRWGLAETALSARVSVLGSAAWPRAGDAGHDDPGAGTPTADQQSLRLMLDGHDGASEWSLHVKAARQNLRAFLSASRHSSDLFRVRALADERTTGDARRTTRVGWEIDRASYKHRFDKGSISLGRQPIDWGSGRLWQPLNVFGAFAPTDLDTDHKPGIDAVAASWYPSSFSSLTAVYALAPRDDRTVDDSAAVHYRRQVGENSQVALVVGRIVGDPVLGASFESDWRGIGWRVEALRTKFAADGESALFWIAGLDYQFDNGTLVSLEWHDNGRGATREAELPAAASNRLVSYGLQQHASRRVLGLSAGKELTPLVRASYTLLASALDDSRGSRRLSLMHQIALVYSVSNESDLLFAVGYGSGKGLDAAGGPRSEFGQIPANITLRWRYYF